MQSVALPRKDPKSAQALWQKMLGQLVQQKLDAEAIPLALVKLSIFTLLLAAALSLAWFATAFWVLLVASFSLALIVAQFAFLGHDAGHGALSRQGWINETFGQLSMTVVTGLAFDEWYGRHRTHHQFCQYEPKDPDMAVDLVVSLTADSREKKTALGRLFTRCQGMSVWFLSLFFAHSQRHLSQYGVLREPRKYWRDLLVLVLHFALWWGLPLFLLHISWSRVLIVYLLPLFILGPYLAAIFWVNHVGMPLIKDLDSFSFLEHQVVTSRTIINPPGMDWFFGGLNFQIEHHLYPQVPSFRLRRLQAIVQKDLEAEHISYHGVSFGAAVRHIAGHFRCIAKG